MHQNTSKAADIGSEGATVVAAAGTPQPIATTPTLVEAVEITAQKDRSTANTGNIYLGFSSEPESQQRVITSGDFISLAASPGRKIDLSKVFIDAENSGDGVTWLAIQ